MKIKKFLFVFLLFSSIKTLLVNPPQQSSKPLSAIIAHQRDIEKS